MEDIELKKVLNDAENDITNGIQQLIYVLNSLVKNIEESKHLKN